MNNFLSWFKKDQKTEDIGKKQHIINLDDEDENDIMMGCVETEGD